MGFDGLAVTYHHPLGGWSVAEGPHPRRPPGSRSRASSGRCSPRCLGVSRETARWERSRTTDLNHRSGWAEVRPPDIRPLVPAWDSPHRPKCLCRAAWVGPPACFGMAPPAQEPPTSARPGSPAPDDRDDRDSRPLHDGSPQAVTDLGSKPTIQRRNRIVNTGASEGPHDETGPTPWSRRDAARRGRTAVGR